MATVARCDGTQKRREISVSAVHPMASWHKALQGPLEGRQRAVKWSGWAE